MDRVLIDCGGVAHRRDLWMNGRSTERPVNLPDCNKNLQGPLRPVDTRAAVHAQVPACTACFPGRFVG